MTAIVKDRITTEPGDNTVEIGVIKMVSDKWWNDDGEFVSGWHVTLWHSMLDPEPLCQFDSEDASFISTIERYGWYARSEGKLAGQVRYALYRMAWLKSSQRLYCPLVALPQYVDAVTGDERCDW